MDRRWVLNASPVILLAKAPVDEVKRGKMSDAGRAWLAQEGAEFIRLSGIIPAAVVALSLGQGETEVLAWLTDHPGFEGVLDDLKARRCASQLGLPVLGSLRVLIILKECGLIPAIGPAVDRFREAGSCFSDAFIREALQLADED